MDHSVRSMSACRLYEDDMLAAEDNEVSVVACYGSLTVGNEKAVTSASFFISLIDDVRICGWTVKPWHAICARQKRAGSLTELSALFLS